MHAIGLDLAPRMVAAAADNAAREGLSVEVMIGDAGDPDLPTGSFDMVTASLVLFFLPKPVAAPSAWGELLVDGGRIGVSTFGAYDAAWEPVDAIFEPYLPPDLRDARITGKQGPFGSDEGVERLLVDAGFADVRTASGPVPVWFDGADHWHRWTKSTGQRRMGEMVPEAERAAVQASAGRLLDDRTPIIGSASTRTSVTPSAGDATGSGTSARAFHQLVDALVGRAFRHRRGGIPTRLCEGFRRRQPTARIRA